METASVGQSTLYKRPTSQAATYSMREICGLFGMSYTKLWEMVQAETFPVAPIKIGRQYKFPKRPVDKLLGLDEDDPTHRA